MIPKVAFIYNRKKVASNKVKATIELRITFGKKQKYISTGVSVYPKQWKNNTVVNIPDAQQINQQLNKMMINVRQVLMDMSNEGDIDIFSILERLQLKRERKISFIDFINQRADIRKYGKAKGTVVRYNRFVNRFKQWGKIKSFEDITAANIIEYDKYLKSTEMKPYSIWTNYHRFLNSFIMDAIDAGYITSNPYKTIDIIKTSDTDSLSKCLTLKEFSILKNISLPTKSLEQVRDVFVFQTYTCLSYSDLKEFDTSKIIEIDGMKVYTGNRKKTGQQYTIPLTDEAMKILEKYNYNLPVISNVKYNYYLKVIAQAAGIDKPVSTHWARHTGATLLLNKGVPMQIVSKICGHSSTRITEQVYAKLLDETIVEAVKKTTM